MRNIKVCHITNAHNAEDVRIFHKECVSLAKAGYEVYLVERGSSYEKNGIHIIGVGEIPKDHFKRITEGARRVYQSALALDCSIYHFHDPDLIPYGLMLKRKGKTIIFDIHENSGEAILEKKYIPLSARSLLSSIYLKYEATACKKFDALITVTPTQTDYFRAINKETTEITNFPIIDRISEKQVQRKNALVFAGGISEQWNHHQILQVLERIPELTYVLCGRENSYLNSLRTMQGWNKVDFRGPVMHEHVLDILSECKIGVALLRPGKNTAGKIGTLGNTKIFEMMLAGLPVVCTDFDLWKEIVDGYKCGICVDPENLEEITEAIQYLIANPDEAKVMGENGRRAVQEQYNWTVEERKLLELYKRIQGGIYTLKEN